MPHVSGATVPYSPTNTPADTSMSVRVACYDCGKDLDWPYTINQLAEMDTHPRCGKHAQIERLCTQRADLVAALKTEGLDDITRLLALTAHDAVVERLAAARAAQKETT